MNIFKIINITLLAISTSILLFGCYYIFIKAGIPYQDAPPELVLAYYRNLDIGEHLIKFWFILSCINGVVFTIRKIMKK